jgi:hypothetical protein
MIKNELVSYQAFACKNNNTIIDNLKIEIGRLKAADGVVNFNRIFTLEKRLDEIFDAQMKSELEKNSLFEILNAEKITPHFTKLLKIGNGNSSLSEIKNDNGEPFNDDKALYSYITLYYRNLFCRDPDQHELPDNVIENFLGPDICNSGVVRNSKLTENEVLMLSQPFSVAELDEAAKEAKISTAAGPDGIGNACIKKIWQYIRIPLTNFSNCCTDNGVLTDKFRTASIRLIPKKGDTGNIKNWRPISLLNCLYKVISRAINNRLKKISHRILSRSQKGFTGGKYIQECLIHIIETIKRCNDFETPSFILAIDQ